MVVGYFFESILGLIFALGFSRKRSLLKSRQPTGSSDLLAEGCEVFFNCTVFFAVSIQIACLIALVRKNSGISANGLGGLTVQITWVVALLCMLPLLYPMVILDYTNKEKSNYRFFLFCSCFIFFFYTFISQMVGDFAPSQVGEGAGPGGATIITTGEMEALTSLCLSEVKALTDKEQTILSAFGAAGSITVSLYGLIYLFWIIIQRQSQRQTQWFRDRVRLLPARYRGSTILARILVVLIPVLVIPQFWGLLRLRGIQKSLANSTGNAYTDDQWTFGQVVAGTIFIPVLTETAYLWIQDHRKERAKEERVFT